jgi:site-specific DNA-adenine methylase
MKNPFYMPYAGNKRTEAEKIYSSILSYDNIETIVEPFCGSCSFSYYCSIQNKDKKFKYVLNDSNGFLKEMYDTMIDKKKQKLSKQNLLMLLNRLQIIKINIMK